MAFRIISIGALAIHELWERQGPERTTHGTTALVTTGSVKVLVDPGLPGPAVAARLAERAGVRAGEITHVFLTSFNPHRRRGLGAFPEAKWLLSETEKQKAGRRLAALAEQEEDNQLRRQYEQDMELLDRCEAAPDKLANGVDLFPLPGYTPGCCGLLLAEPTRTVLLAGEAVATQEHLAQARVLRGAFDVEQATESLKEALEIADVIVPGFDNVILNPLRRRGL